MQCWICIVLNVYIHYGILSMDHPFNLFFPFNLLTRLKEFYKIALLTVLETLALGL